MDKHMSNISSDAKRRINHYKSSESYRQAYQKILHQLETLLLTLNNYEQADSFERLFDEMQAFFDETATDIYCKGYEDGLVHRESF